MSYLYAYHLSTGHINKKSNEYLNFVEDIQVWICGFCKLFMSCTICMIAQPRLYIQIETIECEVICDSVVI